MPPDEPPQPPPPSTKEHGADFILRGPRGLKGAVTQHCRARGLKLSPWMIDAIIEKLGREGTTFTMPEGDAS